MAIDCGIMKSNRAASLLSAVVLATTCAAAAAGQTTTAAQPGKVQTQPMHAKGTFEVKVTPQGAGDNPSLARMSLDKQFQGDLQGTSKGEMLTAMTAVKDSAGYVAIELVTGTLQGRTGTFVLQHNGIMTRGTPNLAVTVVPDSGTGQLEGIAGTMTIKIEGGKHFYEMEYTVTTKSPISDR